jgi:DNA-binding FadR family transcriptional regulator
MFMQHDNERIHREHQAILDACQRRDQDAAKAAAVGHIEGTQRELNRFFEEHLDSG